MDAELIVESEVSGFAVSDRSFKIFDHINEMLMQQEQRQAWVAKEPRVWPSAASAVLYDQTKTRIIGKCHRALFYNMTGTKASDGIDTKAAWKFISGRLLEDTLTNLAKQPREVVLPDPDQPGETIHNFESIFVASGVRVLVPDILLSFELDLVVIDPITRRGVLVENKTFSTKNYQSGKDILIDGKPKAENLLQNCLYLMEIRTGKRLKQLILEGVADRQAKDRRKAETEAEGRKYDHHNRIEVNVDNFDKLDDGPLTAKLSYLDRSDGDYREIDVSIEQDMDGLHYPVVDGEIWKEFPLESVYVRFKKIQEAYYRARQEAEKRLLDAGIEPPEESAIPQLATREEKAAWRKANDAYWEQLGAEMRALPKEFLPPAEYEFVYSPQKVELLWSRGLIAKSKYEGWKKKHKGKERIGDWQCGCCDFRRTCLGVEHPEMLYMIQDLNDAVDQELAA